MACYCCFPLPTESTAPGLGVSQNTLDVDSMFNCHGNFCVTTAAAAFQESRVRVVHTWSRAFRFSIGSSHTVSAGLTDGMNPRLQEWSTERSTTYKRNHLVWPQSHVRQTILRIWILMRWCYTARKQHGQVCERRKADNYLALTAPDFTGTKTQDRKMMRVDAESVEKNTSRWWLPNFQLVFDQQRCFCSSAPSHIPTWLWQIDSSINLKLTAPERWDVLLWLITARQKYDGIDHHYHLRSWTDTHSLVIKLRRQG